MLGECLLDGVGCERDRASALEWLLTAAELGHGLARERALMVLLENPDHLVGPVGDTSVQRTNSNLKHDRGTAVSAALRRDEAAKWLDGQSEETFVNLERRHTIGAGKIKVPTKSAAVKERRKSKVRDSRDEGHHVVFRQPEQQQAVIHRSNSQISRSEGTSIKNPSPES
jgi:TPR repeat protein